MVLNRLHVEIQIADNHNQPLHRATADFLLDAITDVISFEQTIYTDSFLFDTEVVKFHFSV